MLLVQRGGDHQVFTDTADDAARQYAGVADGVVVAQGVQAALLLRQVEQRDVFLPQQRADAAAGDQVVAVADRLPFKLG